MSTSLRGDVVTEWNAEMLEVFAVSGATANPPVNTRAMAMTNVAMYDAVNSVSKSYTPYLGYIPVSGPTDPSAAAAQAAHDVMQALYGWRPDFEAQFDSLLATQLAAIPEGEAKTNGIALGQASAGAVLAARPSDNATSGSTYTTQPVNTPGAWQPGNTAGAWGSGQGSFLMAEWETVTPFAIPSADTFRPPAPPPLTSPDYATSMNQVMILGEANSTARTPEETYIAYYWVDGPGTESPPGHWDAIAMTVSGDQGLTLEENARLFALLSIAEADTAIATWEAKREYDLWRPMQAIAQADIDGNPDTQADPNWTPLLPTPSFPAYTSGHSAFSAAGATVLEGFFGTDEIGFDSYSNSPFLSDGERLQHFDSFSEAADQAGMSRIYGGIHYSFDNTAGQQLGADVGSYVLDNYLLPVPEPRLLSLLFAAGLAGTVRWIRATRN